MKLKTPAKPKSVKKVAAKVVAAVQTAAAVVAEAVKPKLKGLFCPRCECRHVPVYYTRSAFSGKVRRLRECRACGHRFVTVEGVQGR